MRSFVIWYESDFSKEREKKLNEDVMWLTKEKKLEKEPELEFKRKLELERGLKKNLDLHINLWKTKKGKYLFDFGFLLENLENIKNICLYVPFNLTLDKITDLGEIISKNGLAGSIFNEKLTTTDGYDKKVLVKYNSTTPNDEEFFIYHLDVNSQIKLKDMSRRDDKVGKIITLTVPTIDFSKDGINKYYFRFRVEASIDSLEIINNEIKGSSLFNNYFSNTEIIDFRINDIRSCSGNLREKFNISKHFKINKIHYFILRRASDDIIHHDSSIKSRMLEKNIWKDYISDVDKDIIAYHMKSDSKKKISSYTNLTRFKFSKSDWKIILTFLVTIVTINIFSNYLTASFTNWKIILFLLFFIFCINIVKIIFQGKKCLKKKIVKYLNKLKGR